jgi:drug/metabolite transporter (DMT)-like permease
MLLLGIGAALLASVMFNVGAVLQALEARRQPRSLELHALLVVRLLRRPLWLAGFALGVLGIGPQVLALATAPFVLVQPALVVGLVVVLAVGERVLGEPVPLTSWLGVAGIVGGVALLAYAAPSHVETHRSWPAVVGVVAALAVPTLLPFAVRGRRLDGAWVVMVATSTGFAATNIATKLMSDDIGLRHWSNGAAWAAAGLAFGFVATLTNMTAFQRSPASIVVPVTTALQTFLPVVLEPLFLRERWSSAPLYGAPLALGLFAVAAGTVAVARTRAVSDLIAASG